MRALSVIVVSALALAAATFPAHAEEPAPAPRADAPVASQLSVFDQLRSKELPDRRAGVAAAKDLQDAKLVSALGKVLTDEDFTVRKGAIAALAARADLKAKAAAAKLLERRLAPLSKSEDSQGELILVADALGDLAQRSSIGPLMKGIETHTPDEAAEARANAVARVPHKDAIESLITLISRGNRRSMNGQRGIGVRALRAATGENLGNDPDKWRAWWRENEKTFDFDAAAARREEDAERRKKQEERREKRGKKKKKKKD